MIVQVLEQRTKQAKNQLFFDLFIYIFQFIFSLIETECSKMTVSHVRILRVVLLRVDRHVLQQILSLPLGCEEESEDTRGHAEDGCRGQTEKVDKEFLDLSNFKNYLHILNTYINLKKLTLNYSPLR